MSAHKKSWGGCRFDRTAPTKQGLSSDTKILNVIITFSEALKLNLALQDCLLKLNNYKMNAIEGKQAAVKLAILLDQKRVQIWRAKVK